MVKIFIDSQDIYFRYGFIQMFSQQEPGLDDVCFCDSLEKFYVPERNDDLYVIVRDICGKRILTAYSQKLLLPENVFEILYIHSECEQAIVNLCVNCEKKRLFVDIDATLPVMYSVIHHFLTKAVSSIHYWGKRLSVTRCNCDNSHPIYTPREMEVIRLLKLGLSMATIASYLNLNVKTISHYKRSVMAKTGIHRNISLYRWLSDVNITCRHHNRAQCILNLCNKMNYILEFISKNQPCTLTQISANLGYTECVVIRALSLLRHQGEISRILPEGTPFSRLNFLYKLINKSSDDGDSSDNTRI